MTKVKLVINIEFDTWCDATAEAAVADLPNALRLQVLEGTQGSSLRGIIPGTVDVKTVYRRIY
jgi:hypothetical protein